MCLYIWSRVLRPTPTNGPALSRCVGSEESPSPLLFLWCGVPLPPFLPCRVGSWWGRIRGPSKVGFCGGREASLVRQTIFCRRRFRSETLGCPFRCFGRPWRFLLGTIQDRVIESVLITSRPAIVSCTLCYVLYTIYSRVYTIYYKLFLYTWSIFCKTIQRRQSSSSHIASGHVGAQL